MEQMNGQKIPVFAEDASGRVIVARLKKSELQKVN